MDKFLKIKKTGKIYLQLYSQIKEQIEDEKLRGRLLPVRKLAKILGISPSTVAKAYDELEKRDYVVKKEGSGVYVKYEKKSIYLEDHMESEEFRYGYFSPEYEIDFSSATPNETILPMKSLKKAINFVLDRDQESAFLYKDPQGYFYLRETISNKLKKDEGVEVEPDHIQIVSGAQQGIDVVSEPLLYPGDIVVVENPTYRGAKDSFKRRGCKVLEISMEDDGYSIKELVDILKKTKIKLFYTMANFQNPTGNSMSLKKKKKLISLANKHDFHIIEDDGLSDLYFAGRKPKTLKSYDKGERVIYIKSYSKVFMPGLRIAYITLPDFLVKPMLTRKLSSDIYHSGLNQRSFQYLLESGDWDLHMERARKVFGKKQKIMYNALKNIEGIEFKKPNGGLSFWLKLPCDVSGKAVYLNALSRGVGILPGVVFSEDMDDYIRVSFAQCEEKEITEGVKLLGEALEALEKDEYYI